MYNKKVVLLLFITTILIRSIFIISDNTSNFFVSQLNLSKQYFKEGYGIAAGYGYIRGEGKAEIILNDLYDRINFSPFRITHDNSTSIDEIEKQPEMLHPPGLAILVAIINYIFGVRADLPIQILGMLLDSIGAVIIYLILKKYFDEKIGVIVALCYICFPPIAYASSVSKLPEGLLSVFIISYLGCILNSLHTSRKESIFWLFAGGVLLGLGCYLRPDYMLLPVFMWFIIFFYNRHLLCSLKKMLIMQIIVLFMLLPWAYRNYKICGRWIFTSTSVGATLITGLAEYKNSWGFGAFDSDRHKQAIAQGFKSAWEPGADQYFRKLFLNCVHQKPGEFLKTIFLRIPIVLFTPYDFGYRNPYRTKSFKKYRIAGEDKYNVLLNRSSYFFKAYWDRLSMGIISIFSLIGILIYLFSPNIEKKMLLLIFLSPHIYSIFTHMVTHIEPRFLIPSLFSWLFGLAYLLDKVFNRINMVKNKMVF